MTRIKPNVRVYVALFAAAAFGATCAETGGWWDVAWLISLVVVLVFGISALNWVEDRMNRDAPTDTTDRLVVWLYEQRPLGGPDAPDELKEEWREIMRRQVWER